MQREQRGVERRVVGAVVAVAAGPVHVPDRDVVGGEIECFCDRRPQELDALAVREHQESVAVALRDRC